MHQLLSLSLHLRKRSLVQNQMLAQPGHLRLHQIQRQLKRDLGLKKHRHRRLIQRPQMQQPGPDQLELEQRRLEPDQQTGLQWRMGLLGKVV